MGGKRNEFDDLVNAELERSKKAATVVRRQGRPREAIDWRVAATLAALVLWLFAAMVTPIPKLTNAGDEAAARILGFVAGTTCWLLIGAVLHLCVRRWKPAAGLSVITLGATLAAGTNLLAAATPFAPAALQAPLNTHVGNAEVAIRNLPHMLREVIARPMLNDSGFASVPIDEPLGPP